MIDTIIFDIGGVLVQTHDLAPRRFCLRHRKRSNLKLDVPLSHGSLLCMSGPTQHHWLHTLPKTRTAVGERINLTFRLVAIT